MQSTAIEYQPVIGLEVHVRLLTKSKLFCGDANAYGGDPNSQTSPVSLGHPGALPKMNEKAMALAVRMGIACHSEIQKLNHFSRKHYFYPDLPKGFQVTQHENPICNGGFVTINIPGGTREVRLNHIHLEEDAGKSIHDADPDNSCIDLNRAGTPLIEIVSEPDIHSGEEAHAFLSEIRQLIRWLDIGDGNMEEGSLRCDANISIRRKGEKKLGTKVEIKNLNSMRFVKKALEFETQRLIELLDKGEMITQQTRSYDAGNESTFATREKEDADDYRYFPEPDLPPFQLEVEEIERIKSEMPVLPRARIRNYITQFGLSAYDAELLSAEKDFSDYFESTLGLLSSAGPAAAKAVANWMLGPIRFWLNDNKADISGFPVTPARLVELIELVDKGKLSFSAAASKIFPVMIKDPLKSAELVASELNLLQDSDISSIEKIIDEVLSIQKDKVLEYKKGKKGLLALFVGEVMKRSGGRADPKLVNKILIEKLKE